MIAKNKSTQVSPRKVRLVAKELRGLLATEALKRLSILNKRATYDLKKTIQSAIANALQNSKIKGEGLVIKSIDVGGGPVLKRFHPSTRGRVHPYKKRTSHVTVVLEEVR